MRNAFADEIVQLARSDERIVLLSGDIGNRLFDAFKSEFPDRFYNCGVAEANMIGTAAGLAMTGLKPVVYTIASFLIYRPYEQIRIDLGYQQLPVLLIGVGGGFSYASNGCTHHATEDFAAMRAIPGMQVMAAGDSWEVRASLKAALESNQPSYLRIGKKGEPNVHAGPIEDFAIGSATQLRVGNDRAILVTGNLLPLADNTAVGLSERGIATSLFSFHTIAPLDDTRLEALFEKQIPLYVMEEHNRNGGLGTAILEWANERAYDTRFVTRLASPNEFLRRTANQKEAREALNLTVEGFISRIIDTVP